MKIEIWRYPLESARAVKHHRSKPGAMRARPKNGSVPLAPCAIIEGPRWRKIARRSRANSHLSLLDGTSSQSLNMLRCNRLLGVQTPSGASKIERLARSARPAEISSPCVANNARARRSMPKATQPVCAAADVHPQGPMSCRNDPGENRNSYKPSADHPNESGSAARIRATVRPEEPPSAARVSGKWIARIIDFVRQAEHIRDAPGALHPIAAELDNLLSRADAHIFAHSERLESIEIARRLVTKTIRRDIEQIAACRHGAASGCKRIKQGNTRPDLARDRRWSPDRSNRLLSRRDRPPKKCRSPFRVDNTRNRAAAESFSDSPTPPAGVGSSPEESEAPRPRPRDAARRAAAGLRLPLHRAACARRRHQRPWA